MPKITWLGDGDPHLQSISEGGLTFVKGEPLNVNKLHMYAGVNWYNKLVDNPQFSEGDEEVSETQDDKDALKAELDALNVKYPANASVSSLRAKLADAKASDDDV